MAAAGLERFRLSGPAPHDLRDVFLIPDYVSEAEEASLTRQIAASQQAWVQLSGRRLQNHGGAVHSKGFLLPAPMPSWLAALAGRVGGDVPPLAAAGGANHVLINAYRPGEGILPHSDGPLYAPVVSILSLGSPCVIRFWDKQEEAGTGGLPPRASVALPPRSLLVFAGDAYEKCLHGIEEVAAERLDSSVLNPGSCAVAAVPAAAAAAGSARSGGGGGGSGGECCCTSGEGASPASAREGGAAAAAAGQQPAAADDGGGAWREAAGAGGAGGGCELLLPRTAERFSLTIRRVLKVHKGLRLPGAR
ncbi:MAG: hypothetical protein J3K34DRAFT_76723 [Monoraphidium minutum]|nr:MAG: hypothetical protein J3K34DRAFT_76723 [Monoraphidium minutum]